MITQNNNQAAVLDQLTKRSVRAFWMDGLWDLVVAGMFLGIAVWGAIYVQFVAFPSWAWPFLQNAGRNMIWMGLFLLILGITIYFWVMWILVKYLKHRLIYPYTGFAEHRFFMPMDPKVYISYAIIYIVGLGLLYGLFSWIKGGLHVMSIPFIISPAAILVGIGWFYGIRRYLWSAGIGFFLALLFELLVTTSANYLSGPRNFLDTLPEWGSPTLPCLVWAGSLFVCGLIGLINIRRGGREAKPSI